MNPIKKKLTSNINMKQECCIKSCPKELDNQYITWCCKMNEDKDFRLNGTLQEEIQILKQIKLNDQIQNIERIPCDLVYF